MLSSDLLTTSVVFNCPFKLSGVTFGMVMQILATDSLCTVYVTDLLSQVFANPEEVLAYVL